MKLSEIFEQLTYGELAQISIGGALEGGITKANWPNVISCINMALTDLHTKFPLREQELVIQQYNQINYYKLHSDYSVRSQSSQPIKYIVDTAYLPFTDNIIRIERLFDEVGNEIRLNDDSIKHPVYTPAYDTIQVMFPSSANAMFVVYRGDHTKIPLTTLTPSTVEVHLPPAFLPALMAYVAHRITASKGDTESVALSQTLFAKYNYLCDELIRLSVLNDSDNTTQDVAGARGWV